MESKVLIEQEVQFRSRWIKVYVPPYSEQRCTASLLDKTGAELRRFFLNAGHNAIDVTDLKENPVHIKVETPFETVLKEINL
jgi:hypothetical protein